MKNFSPLLFVILITLQFGCARKNRIESTSNNTTDSSMIVGGVKAGINEFSFIASLQSQIDGHFCGGTLIAPKWVLTAAHCLDEDIDNVVLGLYNLKKKTGSKTVAVKNIIIHPKNNIKTNSYDFALLELETAQTNQIALLPPNELFTDKLITSKQVTTIAGWGSTGSYWGNNSNTLLKVNVPLVDNTECSNHEKYQGKIDESMLCAGYKNGGKDACYGDSGGPMIIRDKGGTPYLIGVVSWGRGCAKPNKYGVYGKVNVVLDWITETIK